MFDWVLNMPLHFVLLYVTRTLLRVRSLVVSDLRSETKGSRFESGSNYVQR